jgi:hypothetical protein
MGECYSIHVVGGDKPRILRGYVGSFGYTRANEDAEKTSLEEQCVALVYKNPDLKLMRQWWNGAEHSLFPEQGSLFA